MRRKLTILAALALLTIFGWLGCAGHHHQLLAPSSPPLNDDTAMALLEQRCSVCHSSGLVFESVGTPQEWRAVVGRMMYHHKAKLLAHVTDREAADLAEWLGKNQPVERGAVRIGYQPTGRPF
jgi:hypothetical protein